VGYKLKEILLNDELHRKCYCKHKFFLQRRPIYSMVSRNFMKWDNPGWAAITGASSGIGKAFAEQLAEQGFNLILIARREKKLHNLKMTFESAYNIQVEVVTADLSKNAEIEKVSNCLKKVEYLDVLINNAGFGAVGKFEKMNLKSHLDMMQVHLAATVQLTYSVLKGMVKRNRGVIINTSSLSAFTRLPYNGLYAPTKAFLAVFSETIGIELAKSEVKIQALCAGFTRTEFHDSNELKSTKKMIPKIMWMDSKTVVEKSLRAVYKNKTVYFPGFLNWAMARLVPKRMQKNYFLKQIGKKK
jgi:uncharacterized protein